LVPILLSFRSAQGRQDTFWFGALWPGREVLRAKDLRVSARDAGYQAPHAPVVTFLAEPRQRDQFTQREVVGIDVEPVSNSAFASQSSPNG